MEENKYLVSIIIPTKNRHEQLLKTLLSHSFWPSHLSLKIELIITDNSTSYLHKSLLEDVIKIFPNTIYNHIANDISIAENFLNGFNLSSGRWIVFIGDDDFFMPSIVKILESNYLNTNFDAVVYNPHKYYWDSCVFLNKNVIGYPGSLVLSKAWNNEKIDSLVELKRSLKNGGLTIEKMPRAYHGILKRSVFKKHCIKENKLYLGSPDISLATILASYKLNVLSISQSPTIYGASSGSGGGMTTSKTHILPLNSIGFLLEDFIKNWDRKIPAYWSEYTVFPASILYVNKKYNLTLPVKINYASIYITCFLNEFSHKSYIYSSIKQLELMNLICTIGNAPLALVRKFIGMLFRKFTKKAGIKSYIVLSPSDLIKYDQ